MRAPTLQKILLFGTAMGLYLLSAINVHHGKSVHIGIDINKPLRITWPFEISVVGDMGERGLRIAPKVGRGWLGEAGGDATYRFYIPQDGTYHLWADCLWHDACSNAIYAQFNDLDKAIIGNDPIYHQWHWVRGFTVELKKGSNTLLLSNHSDNVSLQKIMLTTSALAKPDDVGNVFSDVFYDGFDGCDKGNFGRWQVVSGEWQVLDPATQKVDGKNVLIGRSDKDALIMFSGNWVDCSVSVSVRTFDNKDSGGSVGICFGLKDQTTFYELRCHHERADAKARMQLVQNTADQVNILKEFEVPWAHERWHQIEINMEADSIAIVIDDQDPVQTVVSAPIHGGIGFHLEGKGITHFDDVHVRQIENNSGVIPLAE